MSQNPNTLCINPERRQKVLASAQFNGIDAIEVPADSLDAERFIQVFFLKTDHLDDLVDRPDLVEIIGGVRIQQIQALAVRRMGNHLEIEVDRAGDFSTYTLRMHAAWLDPAFSAKDFTFKAGCPSDFDCKDETECPPETYPAPVIDYMAKDYGSFRQALLDLLPNLVPGWKEQHAADAGIALVELLAAAGDQLSYYQDAAANEAFLETARQRISVRRHARLIDYAMHDGASARLFVQFACSAAGTVSAGSVFLTRITRPLSGGVLPGLVIPGALRDQAMETAQAVFEAMSDTQVDPRLNEILLYTWSDEQCCLPAGSTRADLSGDLTDCLQAGDYLIFEETASPSTGLPADANQEHRQLVRLVLVESTLDELENEPVTRVAWDASDALKFPFCISAQTALGYVITGVVRGNLILTDHGRTVQDSTLAIPEAPPFSSQRRAQRILLRQGPLSFRRLPPDETLGQSPASQLLSESGQPLHTWPQVTRVRISGSFPEDDWAAQDTLLNSDRFDHHFAVEVDNAGRALLRFGDGQHGMRPPDGAAVEVQYRVGVGLPGNVGANVIYHCAAPQGGSLPPVIGLSNPLPAWGGADPQSLAEVRQVAPAAFRSELKRAVTEADYTRLAELHPEVQRAVATFRWTGSWHTVFVTIDPRGQVGVTSNLRKSLLGYLQKYKQAGYDLEIEPPIYVPIEMEIDICVLPGHFRAHVKQALLTALDNRLHPDGSKGFFHPDQFTFGQALYLSRLYAALENVPGVDSVDVKIFQRFGKAPNHELEQSFIPMGRLEVVRLDNNPSLPENGVIRLNMAGGK